jgi:pimeloyl-ACP methyl ester carboxylesterase
MSTQELMQEGLDAVKAGNRDKAARLFALVVQNDAHSEMGWLYLGMCRTAAKEKEYCFRRVLFLNPSNEEAQRQLDLLKPPAPPPPPPTMPAEAAPPEAIPAERAEPAWQVPAREERAASASQPEIGPTFGHLPSIPHSESTPEAIQPLRSSKAAKRQGKRRRPWAAIVVLLLLAGLSGGGYWLWTLYGAALLNPPASPASNPIAVPSPSMEATAAPEQPGYRAIFQSSGCPITLPEGANAECGMVVVPEVRGGDPKDTIQLAVIRYRSTSQTPRSDPIIFLQGGPGIEALQWSADHFKTIVQPFLDTRDFVVFDPRGTGRSQPPLKCDDLLRTYFLDLKGSVSAGRQHQDAYEGAVTTCKASLAQAGVQVQAYTAPDMAEDVADVLTALGYTQADLYAVSYGTRVAQQMMKIHPGMVQAAVLDSPLPLEWQMAKHSPEAYNTALQQLFDQCAAEAACAAAYPDLPGSYEKAMEHFRAQPIVLSIPVGQGLQFAQRVDETVFQDAVDWAMRNSQSLPLAPKLIHLAGQEDYSLLSYMLSVPLKSYDQINLGVYLSATCHDKVFALTTQTLDSVVSEMCASWDVKGVAAGENDLGISGIPTLMFSGQFDSISPAALAGMLSQKLTGSSMVVLPRQGHEPTTSGISDCPIRIMHAFLDSPYGPPDQSCAQQTVSRPFVVPYTADMPIEMVEYQDNEARLVTRFPKNWEKAGTNLYMRNNSTIDMTQVGVQKAPVSEEQWLQTITANFNSQGGLDTPPVRKDRVNANDLKWTIYQSAYQGQPVDIAFTSSGPDTYMVIMLSSAEEHEALYQNVFLPMVQATGPLEQ